MSEKTNHGIKSTVMKNEQESGEGFATKSCEQGSPAVRCFLNLDGYEAGNELPGGCNLGQRK